MSASVSPLFVREQLPAITGMTEGLLWSFTPEPIKTKLIDPRKERVATVKPASDALVTEYARWTQAPKERYANTLPPHFFSKYGMRMVAQLVGQVPYNMLSVLNQGCRLEINSLIPRGEPITLRGQLTDCTEHGPRVRVETVLEVSSPSAPNAMRVTTVAAVMLGKQPKKPAAERPAEPNFETISTWSADRNEGQRFFFLTGDFNPIHTFWPLAKRSRFGGCILHGFGSLSRTHEHIQNAGFEIGDMDIKFVKPNKLPNNDLMVQIAEEQDGFRPLRLIGQDGSVYLAGRFAEKKGLITA